jgi:anti-sigma B factor antagonist
MNIGKMLNEKELTINIEGRLDTVTSPQLEAELDFKGVEKLVFNFDKLDYISSAGLRLLLMAQKTMNKQGEMVITNVNETIMEVFEITGFCDILTIQ